MDTYDDFCNRHAPKLFAELTFADAYVAQQLQSYAQRKNYDHILLYGPFGSAKTRTARVIIAERQKALGISNVMIEAYEAAYLKGNLDRIENSVDLILACQQQEDLQPYVLIEEVNELNKTDQLKLRSIINTLPIGKLIMTTNHINCVDAGLISRCDKVEVLLPTPQQFLIRAKQIFAAEGVTDDDALLITVMQAASTNSDQPDMRDIMRVLFQRVQYLRQQTMLNFSTQLKNVPVAAGHLNPAALTSVHVQKTQMNLRSFRKKKP